jgi:hypothetical protein
MPFPKNPAISGLFRLYFRLLPSTAAPIASAGEKPA